MVKRFVNVVEHVENEFLGVVPPSFDIFKVFLTQTTSIKTKTNTGLEESRTNNYTININRSAISKASHDAISNGLKEVFNMSWTAFNWATETFTYYTSHYTGDDEFKKQQLVNIFEFLKDFEQQYKVQQADSYNEFINDKEVFENYKDEEIAVKYNKEIDAVVVLALSFLSGDKYKILGDSSKEKGKFGTSSLELDFFNDIATIKNIGNKMYFTISPYEYQNIKELIQKKKIANADFLEKQEEFVEKNSDKFINYNEKNVFNFKLIFNEEKKCFEFYSKGYNDPKEDKNGFVSPRKVLARWALNFIFSEELSELERETKVGVTHADLYEIDLNNHYKVLLDLKKESSLIEKSLWVPADNWERLNRIYKRFLSVNELFGREEKTIKILDIDFLSRGSKDVNLVQYPSIYLDEKGNPFFIYQYRVMSGKTVFNEDKSKILRKVQQSTSMKGVPISFAEVNDFFTTHPLADHIKTNSIFVNSEIWMKGNNQNMLLNDEERKAAFETIYMHAKLANEAKDGVKVKRKKI